MAYSPGPWQCKKSLICGFRVKSGLGLEVATLTDDWIHDSAKDNANLIAAAPELLEALELVVGTYDEGGWPSATIVIAKAALKKARGV
jgi:hypothetical protein